MHYLCELEISTSEPNVHKSSPGVFHCTFPNSITIPYGDSIKLGVKAGSVRVPKREKNLTFRLLLSKKIATLDLKNSTKTFTINYTCYPELCDMINSLAKLSVPMEAHETLDFVYPAGTKFQGQFSSKDIVKLKYQNSRFLLDLHPYFQLVMSGNLAKILGFDDEILASYSDEQRQEKSDVQLIDECDDKWILLPKLSYISKYRKSFIESGDDEFRFILYDKIDSAFNKANGVRYPSLFEYNLFDRSRMQIIEKKLNVTSLRDFSFGLFRTCDDKAFMWDNDFKKNPFIFTFIFYA